MKRMHFAACLALLACFASAPSAHADCVPKFVVPTLPETASSAAGFVVPGWKMQGLANQDLNGDGIIDIVFVLHDTDKKNIVTIPSTVPCNSGEGDPPVDSNPHLLVVAFGNPGGKGFHRVLANATFIPRLAQSDMDDPYTGISVKHGTFSVKLSLFASIGGGSGNDSYTFRFQHNRFELIGYDDVSVDRSTGEVDTTSADLISGREKLSTGSISDDKSKYTWKTIKNPKTPSIEEIGAADNYQLPE
ncbi:MAG TPA: hypothetical protein VH250_11595 [Granulicella sp.]|nr:hypothetical protein [Granulicella sp.]